jgi:hypothetical protein
MQRLSLQEDLKTFVAGDTGGPVPVIILPSLDKLRFSNQRTAEGDKIRFPVSDDFLHEPKGPQTADHHNRHGDLGFDFFRPISKVAFAVQSVNLGPKFGLFVSGTSQSGADFQGIIAPLVMA